ncbi:hypothetical protein ACIOG4_37425 [Streptomyces microflavus]|uniref:hypothetical protein n=1 Tax=Streptomyces microflavus TaxID=1919 RepID=UPI0037F9BC85
MPDQNPEHPHTEPAVLLGPMVRGGDEKTVGSVHVAEQRFGSSSGGISLRVERVHLIDVDTQPSAESYKPVIIDTPGTTSPLFPSLGDDSEPGAPLPGPMYPDANRR